MTRARVSADEPRTLDQLREHYEIEKELADRLRHATREERQVLYGSVYNELFQRVPLHPQLSRKADPATRTWAIDRQLRMITPFLSPGSTFLEVGAGDCALSSAVAERAREVYAVDVSQEIVADLDLPDNVEVRISDGIDIPVPAGTVDVAYTNSLMEHLHPDDASEQLRNIYESLRPSGVYICITPNRLSGPHDISKYFDDTATGFHLKEYTIRELDQLFRRVGFTKVTVYVGGRGRYFRMPPFPVQLLERLLAALPRRVRHALADRFLVSGLLGVRVIGEK